MFTNNINNSAKLFFLILSLFSAKLMGMSSGEPRPANQDKYSKISSDVKSVIQKLADSGVDPKNPEVRLVRQLKDWTANHKKTVGLNLVLQTLLEPQSPFFKRLMDVIDVKYMDSTPEAGIFSIWWSPCGNYAVSSSEDGTIKIWDLTNKNTIKSTATLGGYHTESINSICFSSDGNFFISCADDKTIKIWDFTNKKAPRLIKSLYDAQRSLVYSVALSSDNKYLISGSGEKVKIWDIRDKANPKLITELGDHEAKVRLVSFSPDGNYFVSCSDTCDDDDTELGDAIIKIWDFSDKTIEPKLIKTLVDPETSVTSLSFTPDGNYFIYGADDFNIEICDFRDKSNPNLVQTLPPHKFAVRSVAMARNGKFFISGSDGKSGTCEIKIWHLNSKQIIAPMLIKSLSGYHLETLSSISLSPDGKYLLSVSNAPEYKAVIKLWDLRFLELYDEIKKLVDTPDTIKMRKLLLLNSILEFRDNQKNAKHELYNINPAPFVISHEGLKPLFILLPDYLKQALIEKNYVEIV